MSENDPHRAGLLASSTYSELRRLAAGLMRRESPYHTLQPTALVHEAYLRLSRQRGLNQANQAVFLAAAARAMRNLLVDHARRKRAQKRSAGPNGEALHQAAAWHERQPLDLLALDEALSTLRDMDPELAQIVEMRFLLGLKEDEVAEALGLSARTMQRGWRTARVWLHRQLSEGGDDCDTVAASSRNR
jgi:RNA polymerase sigma factor (TIGR02999 family)